MRSGHWAAKYCQIEARWTRAYDGWRGLQSCMLTEVSKSRRLTGQSHNGCTKIGSSESDQDQQTRTVPKLQIERATLGVPAAEGPCRQLKSHLGAGCESHRPGIDDPHQPGCGEPANVSFSTAAQAGGCQQHADSAATDQPSSC